MDNLIRAYLKVNEAGEVIKSIFGNDIFPTEPFDYFFIYATEIAGDDDILTVDKCRAWQNATIFATD